MNRELLNRLSSPYAISLRVWLWSTPITVLGTAFTFGTEVFLSHTSVALLMGLATHLSVGVLSVLVSFTYLKKSRWDRPRPLRVLLTYAGMGLGRGLIISTTALVTDIPADPDYLGRAISGMWVFFFWATVLTLVFESSVRFRALLGELDSKLAEIGAIRAAREQDLASVREDFIEQVTRTLAPALDRARAAIDLERLANTLIEPDSYVALETRLKSSSVLRQQAARLGLARIVRQSFGLNYPAAAISALATSALAFPLIYQGGLPGILQGAAIFLSLFFAIHLFSRTQPNSIVKTLLAIACIFVIDAVLAFWLDAQSGMEDVSLFSLSAGMWLVAIFLLFIHSLDHQRGRMVRQLAELVEQLVVLESKLQQELALERRELTQLVHSEVQGRLRAAAVLAKTTGEPSDLQRLKEECIAAMSSGRRSQSMDDFFEELQTMWVPGLRLEIELEPAAHSALQSDAYLRKALQAITREAIINAVKHAEAKSVSVVSSMDTQNTLKLVVINDGKAPAGSRRGLGSQLLDELTTSWNLSRTTSATTLIAILPAASD